jgi:lipopolysaccharide/colanic/teichoic acid biosynthesis glycosyltransferase
MVKRFFDFSCSLIGLILLFPFFLIFGVWIALDSAGPVFYLQERVGKDGVSFKLFKFRTMRVDAEKFTAITVGKRDPRITKAGFILRKFKIDELPQLINVLSGTMSLVGPRPELKRFTDLYTPEQRKVLAVRPGITDPASIRFRNENEMLEGKADPVEYYIHEILPVKLSLNLRYLESRSMGTDIKIIFSTLASIFKKD